MNHILSLYYFNIIILIKKNRMQILMQALQNLHDHNLVHMDIKPENIFISKGDVCKLGDFGLVLDLNKVNTSLYIFMHVNIYKKSMML